MISVFNFPCTFIFTYLLLYLLLNSCDGNDTIGDVYSSVDCWWLWKSRLCRVVPSKRADFCVADAQSDVLSPSRMDVTAFCIDQQLRQWRFVMCLPTCQWCAVQVAGAASFPSQLFKIKYKSEGTRKVECVYHFWKYADAAYPKLSELVRACRKYSVLSLARFFWDTVYIIPIIFFIITSVHVLKYLASVEGVLVAC